MSVDVSDLVLPVSSVLPPAKTFDARACARPYKPSNATTRGIYYAPEKNDVSRCTNVFSRLVGTAKPGHSLSIAAFVVIGSQGYRKRREDNLAHAVSSVESTKSRYRKMLQHMPLRREVPLSIFPNQQHGSCLLSWQSVVSRSASRL